MKTYKVWVMIEGYDDETEEYKDLGLPDPILTTERLSVAEALVNELLDKYNPSMLDSSDHYKKRGAK